MAISASETYNTVAEYHEYILAYYNVDVSGVELAQDEANLRRSTQILDWSWVWKGERTDATQPRSFPRNMDALVDGIDVPFDIIPQGIKHAQAELTYLLAQGVDLTPTVEGGTIRSEVLGAGPARIQTDYDQIFISPKITRVDFLIGPYHNGRAGSLAETAELVR